MAVRFLPPPEEGSASRSEDRGDLAEVIQLRSQLGRRGPGADSGSDERTEANDRDGVNPVEGEPREATREELARLIDSGIASVIDSGVRPVVHANFADHASGSRAGSDVVEQAETGAPDAAAEDAAATEDDAAAAERSVHEDGVRLLARRARSSGELREELARLDHGADDIDGVIEEFTAALYLDDLGLARALTEKLRESKRASRSQIRVKLRSRKLPDDVIEAALGELDSDEEFELLRQTARERAAKLGGLERHVAERRLLGFLARRGWSGEPATRAVKDALDGAAKGPRGPRGGSGVRFQ